jgi:hypothetical protein
MVLSADGKGRINDQVGAMKLNESEESMKHRKEINVVKTRGCENSWDKSDGDLITGQTATGV